jgi:universal stress protein A
VSFRRILIAVDESPVAAHATDVGAQLATALGAELALVSVVDPTQTVAPDGGVPAAELIALAEKDAKRLLAGFRQRAPQGNPSLEFVAVGKPAAEIVKTAKEWPADVIVMTSTFIGRSQHERPRPSLCAPFPRCPGCSRCGLRAMLRLRRQCRGPLESSRYPLFRDRRLAQHR